MKDISQYFADAVKPSDDTEANSDGNSGEIMEPKRTLRTKRNRVKIKISRKNTDERVCDIVESYNDMIDKTPSPFANIHNLDKNSHDGTPKRSSSSKLVLQETQGKRQCEKVDQPSSSLDLNCNLGTKCNKKKERRSSDHDAQTVTENGKKPRIRNICTNDLRCKVESEIPTLHLSSFDEDKCQREESNAFQILMSRGRPVQSISPKKLSPEVDESNVRRSEEHKEKLKRCKENLVALADKKGYSKRKIKEIEEAEKIEQTIQSRIKVFKVEEKKDSSTVVAVTGQRQSSGSLLNYFSKAPLEPMQKDIVQMSTFVVKADVHMSENFISDPPSKLKSNNEKYLNKGDRKPCVDFPEMNNIDIIASEVLHKPGNKYAQERNKRRWSLRIKLNAREGEDTLQSDTDEEIFSPISKFKMYQEHQTKSQSSKYIDTDEADLVSKRKKGIKQQNSHTKFKLKKNRQLDLENEQKETVFHDSENMKVKSEVSYNGEAINGNGNGNGKSRATKTKRCKSPVIPRIDLISKSDSNLENVNESKSYNENSKDNNSKRKLQEKLAPLFTKRQKPDPETLAARRLFLQPDITDTNNRTTDQKVNISRILPFPIISHVTQLNSSDLNSSSHFTIRIKTVSPYAPTLDVGHYKHIMDFTKTKSVPLTSITKPNIQEVLKEIKEQCTDAKKMWEDISLILKEQQSKKSSPTTKTKKLKPSEKNGYKNKDNQIQYSIWTYKYRPMSTQQIVGNEEAATKLKEWLTGWRVSMVNENASSGDEFYSSDCSYSNVNENNQVAILIGPYGSGKSASVYAVAEELDYSVLEVNASSRRTGKKLLKQLEEATKSHRIRKDNGTATLSNSGLKETISKKIPKNSLILLEDVDLIFDEDEGFVSATYQLASNTKRPIVMTCRDVCPHLTRMAPQQNRIYFQGALGTRVSALLELISLAETGYRLPHNCIAELLESGDLRKALLQLQYLLLSGLPQTLEQPLNLKYSLWRTMRQCLYKPSIKVSRKKKTRKGTSSVVNHDSGIDLLNSIACKLDNVALVASLIDVEDSALNFSNVRTQPSLSLIENTAEYSVSRDISVEIADWIGEKVFSKEQLNERGGNNERNTELRKQLNKGVDLALSHTTTLLLDRRIMSLDYLPSIRTICRTEERRVNVNNKRGNRFFHYLHGLKVPTTSLRPNILATACKVMQDKVDDQTYEKNTDSV